MKNFFKLGFVALALSLSVAACNSEKKETAADSTAMDSTSMAVDTTVKAADTTVKVADSTAKVADSTAKH